MAIINISRSVIKGLREVQTPKDKEPYSSNCKQADFFFSGGDQKPKDFGFPSHNNKFFLQPKTLKRNANVRIFFKISNEDKKKLHFDDIVE